MSPTDEQACGEQGPPPFPGAMPYRCSEAPDHAGAHVAQDGYGGVLDTWPRAVNA